jgi:hypothetical protein
MFLFWDPDQDVRYSRTDVSSLLSLILFPGGEVDKNA